MKTKKNMSTIMLAMLASGAALLVRRWWVTKVTTHQRAVRTTVHKSYDGDAHMIPKDRDRAWDWYVGNADSEAHFEFAFLIGVQFGNVVHEMDDDIVVWHSEKGLVLHPNASPHLRALLAEMPEGEKTQVPTRLKEVATSCTEFSENDLFEVEVPEDDDDNDDNEEPDIDFDFPV